MDQTSNFDELDETICDWIQYQWSAPVGQIADTLCGLHHFWPATKHRLNFSWKLFRTWRRIEPPNRAAPLPAGVATAFMARAILSDAVELACLIGLGFHAMLRTGELLHSKCSDIALGPIRGVLNLHSTKSGQRTGTSEAVTVWDPIVLQCLEVLLCKRRCERSLFQPIWASSPQQFRKAFKSLRLFFHLEEFHFQPYSLRRGGATFEMQRTGLLEPVLLRGRWKSLAVARLYLQDGLAHLAEIRLKADSLTKLECAHFPPRLPLLSVETYLRGT